MRNTGKKHIHRVCVFVQVCVVYECVCVCMCVFESHYFGSTLKLFVSLKVTVALTAIE